MRLHPALSAVTFAVALACARPPSPSRLPAAGDTTFAEPRMILIRGGLLVRGHSGGRRDEEPRHQVAISEFLLDETLVTRRAFSDFLERTGYLTTADRLGFGMGASEGMEDWAWERIPGATFRRPFWEETADTASFLRDDAPVVMVSWDDASAFCAASGRRLPTEAEWEYAMRAGREGTRYPWGDEAMRDGRLGLNFWQGESHRHNDRDDGWVYVSPVKAFPPNAWGLYDPVGNVWQWTADYYAATTYAETAAAGVARDPKGPLVGTKRVVRGGSWWCGACVCEGNGLFYRGKTATDAPYSNVGFRCARDP